MKLLKSIKEIWKANKWEYLISVAVVSLGCGFFYVKNQAPLQYSIPLSLVGLTFFMFTFGLFLGGNE